jgi:8-oxo-dGTP pyrophosphatase MutT (NUDIX family)
VLLVRHTYQRPWYLPGGGVKRGETLEQAVRREVAEEVGAELGSVRLMGVYYSFFEGKSDHVAVFVCGESSAPGGGDREIAEYGWFDPENLPDDASPGTGRRVREYLEGVGPYVGRW